MRQTIFFLTFLLLATVHANSQDLETVVGKKSIENYQDYLIKNPRTPNILTLTDSLREMWDRKNIKNYHCFCHCNCLEIFINKKDEIQFEGKKVDKSGLKDSILYAFENPDNHQSLPEHEIIKSKFFGAFVRSKGVVDIISKDASPELYSEIIEIAESAFAEIRQNWAKYFFDKRYNDLEEKARNELNDLIPIRIRFERYKPWNLRLPPPPLPKYGFKGIPDNGE